MTLDQDANKWKANFKANISEISSNYYSDADALARSIAAKIPTANELGPNEGVEELMEQVDDDSQDQVREIFNSYEQNSYIPNTDQIKALIVQESDVNYNEDGDLDSQLDQALDSLAEDWQNNWSSAFGF